MSMPNQFGSHGESTMNPTGMRLCLAPPITSCRSLHCLSVIQKGPQHALCLLAGVLPNSFASSQVGRAVRCTPPEVAQSHAFRPFWGTHGAHGVPALPAVPLGRQNMEEAQSSKSALCRRILAADRAAVYCRGPG